MSRPKLRICLISEEFPPDTGWGGIGSYSRDVAHGLAELGHRVHVISRGWDERETVAEVDGVRIHRIPLPEPSWRGVSWVMNMRFPESRQVFLWAAQVSRAVSKICDREGLDVVESPEYHAQGLLCGFRNDRVPKVVRLHTPACVCRELNGVAAGAGGLDAFVSEQAERVSAHGADLVTSPSRALAHDVSRRWRIRTADVRVIPNPIDHELFHVNGTPRARTVLFVGRLERRKGVQTLIDAWPAIHRAAPEARLVLVGSDHASAPDGGGSMKAHLLKRVAAAGVAENSVTFTSQIERDALPQVYGAAQVCVVPSFFENFPYTCLEAMACGCAVVASHVGGIPEIIEDGINGVLVPPGEPEALADAVVRLLGSHVLRDRLGTSARRSIENRFSRRVVCAQTAAAYASLVG